MRVVISFLSLFFSMTFADAQTRSPWKIDVFAQGCLMGDPTVAMCGSVAWVFNEGTGEIYYCDGEMRSNGGANPSPPNTYVRCQPFPSPTKGAMTFSGPRPVVTPCCSVFNDSLGHPHTDFTNYYWVVGQTINDISFCYSPTKICSPPPTVTAFDISFVDPARNSSSTPSHH